MTWQQGLGIQKDQRVLVREWKAIALLALPILIGQLAQVSKAVLDIVMAGRYSTMDLAAVGMANAVWYPGICFFFGFFSVLQPMIAAKYGAKAYRDVTTIVWQGCYALVPATLLALLLIAQADVLLTKLNLEPEAIDIANGYLKALAWGLPAILLINVLSSLTDGTGRTTVIMVASITDAALNVPLNYLFIHGALGLPELGGVGCGWATSISSWLVLIGLVVYLLSCRGFHRFRLLQGVDSPNWKMLRQIVTVGLPIGVAMFFEVVVVALITIFLTPLGPIVLAGHHIVLNLVSLAIVLPLSVGFALTIRISFLRGESDHATAALVCSTVTEVALLLSFITGATLWSLQSIVLAFYSTDAQVIAVATTLIPYGIAVFTAETFVILLVSLLRAYQDTRVPMLFMLASFCLICFPLGHVLTFTDAILPALESRGYWLSLAASFGFAGSLLIRRASAFSRRTPRPVQLGTANL